MRDVRSGAYDGPALELPAMLDHVPSVHHSDLVNKACEQFGHLVINTHIKVSEWLASCTDLDAKFSYMVISTFAGAAEASPDLAKGGLYLLNDTNMTALDAFNELVRPPSATFGNGLDVIEKVLGLNLAEGF